MNELLWRVTVLLTAVPVVTSCAHVLELPGKRRLGREEYCAIQRIYYPGFTAAGVAEPVGVVVATWWMVDRSVGHGTSAIGWVAVGLLAVAHAVYWILIHPLNGAWLAEETTSVGAKRFFAIAGGGEVDWRRGRDRWEAGHACRAVLIVGALILLLLAGPAT